MWNVSTLVKINPIHTRLWKLMRGRGSSSQFSIKEMLVLCFNWAYKYIISNFHYPHFIKVWQPTGHFWQNCEIRNFSDRRLARCPGFVLKLNKSEIDNLSINLCPHNSVSLVPKSVLTVCFKLERNRINPIQRGVFFANGKRGGGAHLPPQCIFGKFFGGPPTYFLLFVLLA